MTTHYECPHCKTRISDTQFAGLTDDTLCECGKYMLSEYERAPVNNNETYRGDKDD